MFHSSPSSSKRMASSMDVDKVEIPPPVNDAPKSKKQKEVMHEGINVDNDDNSAKVALKGDIVVKSEKGKAIELIQEGYGDSQTMLVFDDLFLPCGKAKSGSESKVKSSNSGAKETHNLIIFKNVSDSISDSRWRLIEEFLTIIARMSTASNMKLVVGSKTSILSLRTHLIFIDFSRYFLTKFCYSIYDGFRFRWTARQIDIHRN
ncbi:uncharacterized protein LOC109818441 [Cajanus cajan]|uniref:uncharacterized protein LOC109818441 n=1 Tax=Cajanus cajan TaxID=3821 RepID=UPI00098DA8F9|nr:uncharacterized protein LOC109818441 [Cajanus cajan]